MSKKGHYSGGSTIIRAFPPSSGGRKPQNGILDIALEDYRKYGLRSAVSSDMIYPTPETKKSLAAQIEVTENNKKVKKKGVSQKANPKRFIKPTKTMSAKATKRFIQDAKRNIDPNLYNDS